MPSWTEFDLSLSHEKRVRGGAEHCSTWSFSLPNKSKEVGCRGSARPTSLSLNEGMYWIRVVHESEVDSVSQSHRSACLSPRVDSGYGRLGSAPARPAVPEKGIKGRSLGFSRRRSLFQKFLCLLRQFLFFLASWSVSLIWIRSRTPCSLRRYDRNESLVYPSRVGNKADQIAIGNARYGLFDPKSRPVLSGKPSLTRALTQLWLRQLTQESQSLRKKKLAPDRRSCFLIQLPIQVELHLN